MKLSDISTDELKAAVQQIKANSLAPVNRQYFQYESLANSAPDVPSVEVYSLQQLEVELSVREA